MPKQPLVSKTVFESAIIDNKSRISEDGFIIKPPSNVVWRDISSSINGVYSTKYIYIYVKQNRNNIWEKIGISSNKEGNEVLKRIEDSEKEYGDGESSSENNRCSDEEDNLLQFTLTLTSEEWDSIKPQNLEVTGNQSFSGLRPNLWTSIINDMFWAVTSLPCCLSFKRAQVNKKEFPFLRIKGRCNGCESQFKGKMEIEPYEGNRAVISCQYIGSFKGCRTNFKRKLTGRLKDYADTAICEKNMAPSAFRNLEASKIMKFGDPEPSHIPTANALRILKHKRNKKDLINEDPILSINIMMHSAKYQGSIKALGYDPFHAIYWTSSQMKVYNMYCKTNQNSKLCLDATGSIVKRISRPFDRKSKHIFLYEAAVRDDNIEKQYSVTNMLSEAQDNIAISYWLSMWKKHGAAIPKEIVCDHSIALLSAAVKSFTQFSSLQNYLENCSNIIFNKVQENIPHCFIRCDVAHTIKLIASWDVLKGKSFRTRTLYIRSLAQIVQSTNIDDLKKILEAIVIVALSETEGIDVHTGEETLCETSKLFLKERISSENLNESIEQLFSNAIQNYNESHDINVDDEIDTNETGLKNNKKNFDFLTWFRNLVDSLKNKVISEEGDHDNAQYLPEIIKNISHLIKRLPLWSGIMIPFFGFGHKTTSSAPVESSFKFLKHQIFNNASLPLRVDKFIDIHLGAIDGHLKLVGSVQKKNEEKCPVNGNRNVITQVTSANEGCDVGVIDSLESTNTEELSNISNQCIACSNGHLPTGAHKCIKCGINVHLFQECSFAINDENEGYGEKRLCSKCHAEPQSLPEDYIVENWKGLTIPHRKRKRNSYLEVNTEFRNVDFSSQRRGRPIGILRNGSETDLKPLKFENNYVIVTNTCAYDAFIQIFASAFSDSKKYQQYIESESSNYLFDVIRDVALGSITTKTYFQRAQLIREFNELSQLPQNIFEIKAECTANVAAKNMFSNYPSCIETIKCARSGCVSNNVIKKPLIHIIISNVNIHTLQNHIDNFFQEQRTTCLLENDGQLCNNIRLTSFHIPGEHFIIEIINENPSTQSDIVDDIKIRVTEVPQHLHILGKDFYLRGLLAFYFNEGNNLGHYIALCKRLNDFWELYDDLDKKKKNCGKQKKFPVQCLVYTV